MLNDRVHVIKDQAVMIRLLNALFPNVTIYLFGSRAWGTAKPTSDIDLALDAGRKLTFLEIQQARNALDVLYIPQKIDIVDMHSIPEELKNDIIKRGIIWKI